LIKFVLTQLHNSVTGGHLGIKKTLSKVRERFSWFKQRQDVENWCRHCDICASKKRPNKKPRAPLQQYNVGAPLERIAVDILGPLPRTNKGNRYLLVVGDYFSKWSEAIPIRDQEAITVANKLVDRVISILGVPMEIHSDQGSNFESQVFKEMCKPLGLKELQHSIVGVWLFIRALFRCTNITMSTPIFYILLLFKPRKSFPDFGKSLLNS
jgi:hypothetical protein